MTSPKIRKSMEFVREFLWEQLSIRIDYPTSQGGTTFTGNVERICVQRKNDSDRDFSVLGDNADSSTISSSSNINTHLPLSNIANIQLRWKSRHRKTHNIVSRIRMSW